MHFPVCVLCSSVKGLKMDTDVKRLGAVILRGVVKAKAKNGGRMEGVWSGQVRQDRKSRKTCKGRN